MFVRHALRAGSKLDSLSGYSFARSSAALVAAMALASCTPAGIRVAGQGSNAGFTGSSPSAGGAAGETSPNLGASPTATPAVEVTPNATMSALAGTVLDPSHNFLQDGTAFADVTARFPVFQNTGISVLDGGPQYLSQRMRLLEQATRSVRLQSFIFSGDESGYLIADKLKELVKKGISVRVAVDDVANSGVAAQMMYFDLKRHGVQIEGYESTYLNAVNLFSGVEAFSSSFDKANKRFHDKLIVVDAELPERAAAIVGGANIANEYFQISLDYRKNWHDKDVVVRGPQAASLAKVVDSNMALMASLKASETALATDPIWAMVFKYRPLFNAISIVYKRPDLDAVLSGKAEASAKVAIPTAAEPSVSRFLQSRPRQGERHIHKAYIDLVRGAKSEILIENSYFVPTADFQTELIAAAKRGVKIRILTNHPDVSDFQAVQLAGRSLYKNMLSDPAVAFAGVPIEIYEWAGHPVLNNGQGLDHAKLAVFDNKIAVVGSYNLDPRSQFLNSETVQIFSNRSGIDSLVNEFNRDVSAEFAKRITYAEAKLFSEPSKLLDTIKLNFVTTFQPYL